tara:strand:+ start:2638 stop:4254 length:1617 start_codon:yes stop_codon:yes gene_type:complete
MKGLPIRSPWIELILSKKKIWEIRGQKTKNIKQPIALIKSGTKTIVGVAKIDRVLGPFTLNDFRKYKEKHLSTEQELQEGLPYKNTYAWELTDVVSLLEPVPYHHTPGAITWVNIPDIELKDLLTINKRFKIPKPHLKEDFLKSLNKDLRILNPNSNFNLNLDSNEDYHQFEIEDVHYRYRDKSAIQKVYSNLRNRLLRLDSEFILEMENKRNVLSNFGNGQDIDIEKISPEIEICTTKKSKDLFKYCRYLQDVPNTGGIGRRIMGIVYDNGQENRYIMGVFSLASVGYSLKCRDDYFGWNNKIHDSVSNLKELKDNGLRKIMQLSVSLAAPPYNSLHLGKFIALSAFTDTIQNHYSQKYGHPLLALITTSATELHSSVYKRIQLNKIFNDKRNRTYLFERIGQTSQYSSLILSKETKEIAKKLLENSISFSRNKLSKKKNFGSSSDILKALKICGLNKSVLELNEKGVYIGALHENNIEILKGNKNIEVKEMSLKLVYNYWYQHFYQKKILLDKERIEKFKTFDKNSMSIANQLSLF